MKPVRRRIIPAEVVFGANAGSLQTQFQDRGELSGRPQFRRRTCAAASATACSGAFATAFCGFFAAVFLTAFFAAFAGGAFTAAFFLQRLSLRRLVQFRRCRLHRHHVFIRGLQPIPALRAHQEVIFQWPDFELRRAARRIAPAPLPRCGSLLHLFTPFPGHPGYSPTAAMLPQSGIPLPWLSCRGVSSASAENRRRRIAVRSGSVRAAARIP
jgi:hypothetical protein